MAFDPKIRSGVLPRVTVGTTTNAPAKTPETAAPKSTGYAADSTFDAAPRVADKASEGRAKAGGVQDDSIGRAKAGGVQDDSIGRAKTGGVQDDSIGRAKTGGVQDDSIGRAKTGGVQDDSIGRTKKGGVQDDSIGRTKKGGVQDDSIGRAKKGGVQDDTIGRTKKGGVQDDTIGRTGKGGVQDDTIGGASFDAVRYALVGPDSDPAHNELRDAIFARLENPSFAYDLAKGATGATEVLKNGIATLAKSLPAAAKEQLSTVMGHLDEEGLRLLGAAMEKSPKLLSNVDSKGGTVLSNLARLASQPLNAKLAGDTSADTVLRGVLRDIVNPNRVDQGTAPTCTVTSMQFELVADEPGEYTRLMADLCGPDGKSKMRGGGDLTVEAGDVSEAARDWRSASQTIFQTAAMEYANGRFLDFDPVAGKSTDARTGEQYAGIKPSQLANVLSKLFGVKYSTDNLKDEKEGAKVLETLRGYTATGAENRPIILHIDQGDYNHAVTLERVANGQVQYRDPYGLLRSMPEDLFPKYVMAVQRPMDSKVA